MRQACSAFFLFTFSVIASAQIGGTLLPMTPSRPASGQAVAAIPVVQKWQTFVDPNEGSFQVQLPSGWQNSGGLKRYDALQYRVWVTSVSPNGATILEIGDPNEPAYATPMMGFAPGSIYNATGTYYIVEPLQSPQQYAVTWGTRKLQGICTGVKVTANRARTDVNQQLAGIAGMSETYGDATFTCQRNGVAMSAYAFLGVTVLRTTAVTALWYADNMVVFVAPAPVAIPAANVLAQMIKSFTVNPQWLARQSQTAAQVSQIATRINDEIYNTIMAGWDIRNGEVHAWVDPSTGVQYDIPNNYSYSHYWVDSSGNVYGSNSPTSPGSGYTPLNAP